MFHYATMSTGEVDLLRRIQRVIRKGRVQAIAPDAMILDQGDVAMEPGTLYVDCTASAISHRKSEPVFGKDRIQIQLLRAPLVTFSAALTAYVEAHGADDEQKNQLCVPVPFPKNLAGYVSATQISMMNQFRWSKDNALRQWLRNTRLDGFGKMVAELSKDDTERQAILAQLRTRAMAAMSNLPNLLTAARYV